MVLGRSSIVQGEAGRITYKACIIAWRDRESFAVGGLRMLVAIFRGGDELLGRV